MKVFRGFAFSLVLLVAAGACQGKESVADRCVQVRDQLIELELRADDPDRDAHARIMRRAQDNRAIAAR
jgi:hypothetical protein